MKLRIQYPCKSVKIFITLCIIFIMISGCLRLIPVSSWEGDNVDGSEISYEDFKVNNDSSFDLTPSDLWKVNDTEVSSNNEYYTNIIVEMKGEPVLIHFLKSSENMKTLEHSYTAKLKSEHNTFLQTLTNYKIDFELKREYTQIYNGVALRILRKSLDSIKQLPDVVQIYKEKEFHICLDDSIPLINADDVWEIQNSTGSTITGKDVTVAVIDTGVDYSHPDLGGGYGVGYKVIGGYDFVNDDADPMDDHSHGTHCAGIVAANGTVKGVAPDAKILAYKSFNIEGRGTNADCIAGIEQAVIDGADVISMSWGNSENVGSDDPVCQAVQNAIDAGIVAVAAAGNYGPSSFTITWPASLRDVITVGASTKGDTIVSFSSRGPSHEGWLKPDVLAPGEGIYSTLPNGGHGSKSGTSMACPHVSGAAALLLQMKPNWGQNDIKTVLMNTAVYLGYGVYDQGAGRIDLLAAATAEFFVRPPSIDFGPVSNGSSYPISLENFGNTSVEVNCTIPSLIFGPCGCPEFNHSIYYDYAYPDPQNLTVLPASTSTVNLTFVYPKNATEGYYLGELLIQTIQKNFTIPFTFGIGSDRIINTTELWENQSLTINGNIVIQDGGNLTLRNVSISMSGLYESQNNIVVEEGGEFFAYNDTTITSYHQCYKYNIDVWGRMIIDKCNINRTAGLRIYSDNVTISNSTLRHDWKLHSGSTSTPYGHIIFCHNASPIIFGNKIQVTRAHEGNYGVDLSEPPRLKAINLDHSNALIFNNNITLTAVKSAGIFAYNFSHPTIRNNTVWMDASEWNSRIYCRGIYAADCSFKVENITISDIGEYFDPGDRGITSYNSSLILTNSTISLYPYSSNPKVFPTLEMFQGSEITLVHSTVDTINITRSLDSSLYFGYFLHVKVVDEANAPIPSALVRVQDLFDHEEYRAYTGTDGWMKWGICRDYGYYLDKGYTVFTPHNVTAVNETSHWYAVPEVIMDGDKSITIVIPAIDTPPVPPDSPSATAHRDDIILTWSSSLSIDIDHYLIYRSSTPSEFNFSDPSHNTSIDPDPLVTTWTDISIAPNWKMFFYIIRGVDTNGNTEENMNIFCNGNRIVDSDEPYTNMVATLSGNLYIKSGGTLSLDNFTLNMNCSYDGEYGIEVREGGILNLTNSTTITNTISNAHYAIHFFPTSSGSLSSSTVRGFGSVSGSRGLYVKSARVTIEDCTIKDASGGLIFEDTDVIIENTTIDNCTGGSGEDALSYNDPGGDGFAGGVSIISSGDVVINNTRISNCIGGLGGTGGPSSGGELGGHGGSGAILCRNSFDIVISNLLISQCIGGSGGSGGIANGSTGNWAGDGGLGGVGGVYIYSSTEVTYENNTIENTSGGSGGVGGIACGNMGNWAGDGGLGGVGGVYIYSSTEVTFENNTIENTSGGSGGVGGITGGAGVGFGGDGGTGGFGGVYFTHSSIRGITSNIFAESKGSTGGLGGTGTAVNGANGANGTGYGLFISACDNSKIKYNTISDNEYGLNLTSSNGNTIYHNKIIQNINQAYDDGNNQWDNGYPSGGNYWSDYSGVDIYSGSNQDQPGSDGIGDTNYTNIVGGSNVDNYPLMPPTKFDISLQQGWNLISLPLIQNDESLDKVLESINGKWDYIMAYDSLGPDHWKTNATSKPDQLNDLKTLDHKIGFWINITEPNVNFTVYGYKASITRITLHAGWNLVSYPTLNNTEIVANALWDTGADRVEKFDALAPYRISEVGPNYIMKPGEGYWIHVPADTIWTVDW